MPPFDSVIRDGGRLEEGRAEMPVVAETLLGPALDVAADAGLEIVIEGLWGWLG